MEGDGMPGGMMPSILGLEMPLHQPHHHHPHHQPPHPHRHQTPPPPPSLQQQQQQLLLFSSQPPQNQAHHSDADHGAAVASKHVYPFGGGSKVKPPAPSSEDEPSSAFGDECAPGGVDLGTKPPPPPRGSVAVSSSVSPTAPSPWQRMKWTDTMVKLLIMVVYCVGDDGGPDGGGGHHTNKAAKKGASAAVAGGGGPCTGLQQQQQQKKGKWKSVSRAMMEKGYYVSPQQCEDKFNDLNKRYKRVNDILGKGTACRVVENQALLDNMDHLSPKAKEEVRKLLNSKHLFFREMCAYHRSCAAAASGGCADAGAGEAARPPSTLQSHHQSCETSDPHLHQQQLQQQQRCFHAEDIGSAAAFSTRGEEVGTALKMMTTSSDIKNNMGGCGDHGGGDQGHRLMAADEEDDDDDYEDDDDDDCGDDEDDANDDCGGGYNGQHHHRRQHRAEEEEDSKEFLQAAGLKRQRVSSSSSPFLSPSPPWSSQQQQLLRGELAALTGTLEQQRQWLRWRAAEMEERRVSYGRRGLELERQRYKWLRFSGNKEREMERAKLENQRLSLENERMLLLLRQKEMDLFPTTMSSGGGAADRLHNSGTSPAGAPSGSAA